MSYNIDVREIRNYLLGIRFEPSATSFLNKDFTFRVPMKFKEFEVKGMRDISRLLRMDKIEVDDGLSITIKKSRENFLFVITINKSDGGTYSFTRKVPKIGLIKYMYYLLSCNGDMDIRENIFGYHSSYSVAQFTPESFYDTLLAQGESTAVDNEKEENTEGENEDERESEEEETDEIVGENVDMKDEEREEENTDEQSHQCSLHFQDGRFVKDSDA